MSPIEDSRVDSRYTRTVLLGSLLIDDRQATPARVQ